MTDDLLQTLHRHGFQLYPASTRLIGARTLFAASRNGEKFIGVADDPGLLGDVRHEFESVTLHALSWENYRRLAGIIPISPSRCDREASFGTGDRLGLVSAAHLDALKHYPVFPIIAQQSPRELARTGRDFKDVLLKAAMGVLESGFEGKFGADADHIKDEAHLRQAAEAGYSMYTLDVSDWLSDPASEVSDLSRETIARLSGRRFGEHVADERALMASAAVYQSALDQVVRYHGILKERLADFDLEISIDEGARETTPEDHLFVAEYLHARGIDVTSLAPKFPGKFQKGIDYVGDAGDLARSLGTHSAICRELGGYRLSLHSGSDKFSIYRMFAEITGARFHVKTSGTSWLQAVSVIASADEPLFHRIYGLCLENLDESRKAYDVTIAREDFPESPEQDGFLDRPDVRQLFHISYGVVLDHMKDELFTALNRHEEEHYSAVSKHIRRHLEMLE